MQALQLRQIVDTVQTTKTLSIAMEDRLMALIAGRKCNDIEVSILKKLLAMLESDCIFVESEATVPAAA